MSLNDDFKKHLEVPFEPAKSWQEQMHLELLNTGLHGAFAHDSKDQRSAFLIARADRRKGAKARRRRRARKARGW